MTLNEIIAKIAIFIVTFDVLDAVIEKLKELLKNEVRSMNCIYVCLVTAYAFAIVISIFVSKTLVSVGVGIFTE